MYMYVPGAMVVWCCVVVRRVALRCVASRCFALRCIAVIDAELSVVGETLPYTHQGRSGLQGTRNNISLPPRNSSHIAGLAETQVTKALFSRLASYCHQAEAVSKAPGITFHCLCSVPGPPHCRLSTCIDIWQQPG
ncbi:hypothetical protein Pelo_3565 [Pelomyxa schiedti]|nr:hypothetical protein Pelo_3565 [Pelomyxa schiedti]